MINFGAVPAGAVLPVFFATYGGTNGESITLTGLAVTDIEIYKGISTTQRASDAGYTLMDTDGIDVDSVTGIHGFSIDTGDNTDASFYAVGSFFTVVVSAVTVDSQTVNFIAATFSIAAAVHTAGYPVVTIKDGTGTGEIDTTSGGVLVAAIAANAITATAIAADAITDAKVASDVTISAVTGAVGSVTGAVGSVTGAVGSVTALAANSVSASALATDAVTEIADGILDRNMATGTDSGSTTVRTMRQALRFLRNKWSISGTTLTVTKEDDSTASWTSEVTATAGADPITANDPAGP